MTVIELRYERVVNLGSYETIRVGATATVDGPPEGEMAELVRFVEAQAAAARLQAVESRPK